MLNKIVEYKLPNYSDPEGCSVTVSIIASSYTNFVLAGNIIIFNPINYSEVGMHLITVTLTDL
jgi:hypothetical protein